MEYLLKSVIALNTIIGFIIKKKGVLTPKISYTKNINKIYRFVTQRTEPAEYVAYSNVSHMPRDNDALYRLELVDE